MHTNTVLNYIFTFSNLEEYDKSFETRNCSMKIIEENKRTVILSMTFSTDPSHEATYALCCYAGDCWITDFLNQVCVFLNNPSDSEKCANDLIDFELEDDELEELGTAVKTAAYHCWCETYPDKLFVRNYIYVPEKNDF